MMKFRPFKPWRTAAKTKPQVSFNKSGSGRDMAGRDVWPHRSNLNGSLHIGHACLVNSAVFHYFFLNILAETSWNMSGRQNNKLPNNLPQLQNLIKRDPQSYVEEVSVVSQDC